MASPLPVTGSRESRRACPGFERTPVSRASCGTPATGRPRRRFRCVRCLVAPVPSPRAARSSTGPKVPRGPTPAAVFLGVALAPRARGGTVVDPPRTRPRSGPPRAKGTPQEPGEGGRHSRPVPSRAFHSDAGAPWQCGFFSATPGPAWSVGARRECWSSHPAPNPNRSEPIRGFLSFWQTCAASAQTG